MYTWEIENTIRDNGGVLDAKTYLHICNTSPQIRHIIYEQAKDIFHLWTHDKQDDFIFRVVLNKY